MRLQIYSRFVAKQWHCYKTVRLFPRQYPTRRDFHASSRALVVKPFLLADIGEGKFFCQRESYRSNKLTRHSRVRNHTMVRRTGSSSGGMGQVM